VCVFVLGGLVGYGLGEVDDGTGDKIGWVFYV
jgi:hypothetical protein